MKFKKLANGNVIVTDGSDNIQGSYSPNKQVLKHPNEPNLLIISDDSSNQESNRGLVVSYSSVDKANCDPVIVADNINELITALSSDFFFKVKLPVSVESSDITFKSAMIFGTFSTPITTPITSSNLGAIVGNLQKIYHKADSFDSPEDWNLIGSGVYVPNEVNLIFAEFSEVGRIEYWITQDV